MTSWCHHDVITALRSVLCQYLSFKFLKFWSFWLIDWLIDLSTFAYNWVHLIGLLDWLEVHSASHALLVQDKHLRHGHKKNIFLVKGIFKFSIDMKGSFSLYFILLPPFPWVMWRPLPVPSPWRKINIPCSLSSPMHRVYQSASKYIWGKCLKACLGRRRMQGIRSSVKGSLDKSGFKGDRFITVFKLLCPCCKVGKWGAG